MATQAATPITTIQELLAAHAARMEGYEQLKSRNPANGQQYDRNIQESQGYVSQLMEELAAYGDATHSEVNRDTPLHKRWSAMTASENSIDQVQLADAEEALLEKYRQTLRETADLPESLEKLLQKQLTALANTNTSV
jgi:hypothetical protein